MAEEGFDWYDYSGLAEPVTTGFDWNDFWGDLGTTSSDWAGAQNLYGGILPGGGGQEGVEYTPDSSNTLSDIWKALSGGLTSVSGFLSSPAGKGLLGIGGGISSLLASPDQTQLNKTTTQPLGPYGQAYLPGMFNMAMTQPTAISDEARALLGQMNLSDYMNAFPAETWNRAEANIPATQAAMESNLAQALGRVAPNAYSTGTNVQEMIRQVSANDYQTRQLLTNLLTQRAGAEQAATLAQPSLWSGLLGITNYPQTYQRQASTELGNLYNQLATLERGGQPQMISATGQTEQDLWSKLAPILGALASTKQ